MQGSLDVQKICNELLKENEKAKKEKETDFVMLLGQEQGIRMTYERIVKYLQPAVTEDKSQDSTGASSNAGGTAAPGSGSSN